MKYIIAIRVDNKGEIFEFNTKEERTDFFKSLVKSQSDGSSHITDVAFSQIESENHSKLQHKEEAKNNKNITQYQIKEIDFMFNLVQALFIFLALIHSFYGHNVFPILCLIALNAISDRYFNWRSK
tara:strand:+ start:968 stop:1345 length:378 start_codon:yes stop_codon:yes gene_type:complete